MTFKPVTPGVDSTRLLIFGRSGIGKTRLIATSGKGTALLRPPTENTDSVRTPGVDEWVINDWSEMDDALQMARQEGSKYRWWWLDSISLWQDQGLDDIWQGVIDRKPDRAKHSLDQGEYGVNMHRLQLWVRHMVGASKSEGFNFGITAHPRDLPVGEDAEADEALMPWVQGKHMAAKVCGYMNIVAFMELTTTKNRTRRVLRFNATERYYAKDQFDAFEGGRLLDPSMPKIEERIEEARAQLAKTARPKRKSTARRRRAK